MAAAHREREDKFDVDAGFVMPELSGFTPEGGQQRDSTVRLRSTYYDTVELTLLALQVTLRRRDGDTDTDTDTGWHLKLPAGRARTELQVGLAAGHGFPDDGVPAELATLLSGLVAVAELRPVAIVDTERRLQLFADADDVTVAQVADDLVHAGVPGDAAAVSQWREVEIELGTGTGGQTLLRTVGERLLAAGARRSAGASKLARALGSVPGRGAAVADLTARSAGSDAVTGYLAAQYHALGAGHVSLRRGLDPVHATRVATRRLRSTLRVFGELFDPATAAGLDTELGWYAGLLGQVRDRQVQRARFAAALDSLPPELTLGPVAAHIQAQLLSEQLHHHDQLMAALDTARYRQLMSTVAAWASGPPFTPAAGDDPDGVARLVRKATRRTGRKTGRRLRAALATGEDVALHRARKAAKRARYAAELAAPVLGKKAARAAIKHHKRLQTVLGEHQDSVVAADLLRRLGAEAGTTAGHNGFTYGLLYAHEQAAARASRAAAADLAN